MRSIRVTLGVAILVAAAMPAVAQRSPVQDLLATARLALNDLRFADADSILRGLISYDLRRVDRIQALQLLAGVRYPEQETAQQRDRAISALRDLVRLAPSASLPREVSWSGLEALLAQVREDTFGASVTVREHYVLTGPEEVAEVEVLATRPATFLLRLTRAIGGEEVFADTLFRAAQSTMRLRALRDGVPRFLSGDYILSVTAYDTASPDSIPLRFSVKAEVPPIEYVPVPAAFDESRLLPEVTRPRRVLGIVGGALLSAGTIAASRVLRDPELKAQGGADGRAMAVGLVLGIGTVGGVWLLDRGEPIPANTAANREARADFERQVREARATNAEILKAYRAQLTLDPEPIR